jgi:hypothetical protein
MKSLTQLRMEADRRKSDFFANIAEIQTQLTPDNLLEQALQAADPGLLNLKRMETQAKNNPFAVLAALTGLYVLARQLTAKSPDPEPGTAKRGRRFRLTRSTLKGDHHGNFDNSKFV